MPITIIPIAIEMLIHDQWEVRLSSTLISFIQKCTYWEIGYQHLVNMSLERQLILVKSLPDFRKHQHRRNNETPRQEKSLPCAVQARKLPIVVKMQFPFSRSNFSSLLQLFRKSHDKGCLSEVWIAKGSKQQRKKYQCVKCPIRKGLLHIYPGTVMRGRHSSRKFNIKKINKLKAGIYNRKAKKSF